MMEICRFATIFRIYCNALASGYVKIAIENCHLELVYPFKMVDFP